MAEVTKGSIDVTRYIMIVDASTGVPETGVTITDLDLQYTRNRAAPVAKADATALAATDSAHSDNKMIEVDATSSPGLYRVDWPDAAFAGGVEGVLLTVTGSGYAPAVEDITLVDLVQAAVTGSAVNTPAESYVLTTGTQVSGTYASTAALDEVYHQHSDDAGTMDLYYQYSVGGDGVPTSVTITGRLTSSNDALKVYAYNWGGTSWDQIGTLGGQNVSGDIVETYSLFTTHVGLGANLGKVRIRFQNTGLTSSNLYVDQMFVSYSIASRTVGYADGAIWVDTNASNTNTESYVDGTADNPVSTWAAALTLSGNLNLTKFHIAAGSSITLSGNSADYTLVGENWTLNVAGQVVNGIYVQGAIVTGTMTGTGTKQIFKNCTLGTMTLIKDTYLIACGIKGPQTIGEQGNFFYDRCYAAVAGTNTWTFDFTTGSSTASYLNVRNYSGGIQLKNMGNPGGGIRFDHASIEGQGQIIEDSCTYSTVSVRGLFTISGADNLVFSDDARLDIDQVSDASGRLFNGTATASSTPSKVFVQSTDPPVGGVDGDYDDTLLLVWRGTEKADGRLNVRVIDHYDDSDPSFTVTQDLSFTPIAGDIVEVWAADVGALSALNMLTSGFGSTSPDRLVDHFRAMMSKGASAPSTGVGTYDSATDSLEHIGESLDSMAGAGFDAGTDSLQAIRDAIDTLVAPSVVSSSSLSGSGFLADCVSLIRKATDEPGTTPKYTDGDIIELLQVGIDAVLTDIAVNTDHPMMVRHSVDIVSGTQDYVLPPQVGELHMVTKESPSSTLPEYEVWPGSHFNPTRTGWKIEGNILRLLRDWQETVTLQLLYTPNAEPLIHKATATTVTASTITFPATVTDGTLGTRPNEYVGMIVRILSSTQNIKEERMIIAYDVETRVATLNKAWDTTPTGTVVYEVVPIFGRLIKHVVCLRTAIDLLSQEGNSQRMGTLERNYILKLSAMRRAISKKEGRFPGHLDGDTWDNENRGGFFGYG